MRFNTNYSKSMYCFSTTGKKFLMSCFSEANLKKVVLFYFQNYSTPKISIILFNSLHSKIMLHVTYSINRPAPSSKHESGEFVWLKKTQNKQSHLHNSFARSISKHIREQIERTMSQFACDMEIRFRVNPSREWRVPPPETQFTAAAVSAAAPRTPNRKSILHVVVKYRRTIITMQTGWATSKCTPR